MPITLARYEPARLDWQAYLAPGPAPPQAPLHRPRHVPVTDAGFIALQAAYRGHGGIARGEALATCLAHAGLGGYVELARRIVADQLFSFQWQDSFWVPMFQFDPLTHTLRTAPAQVLGELHGVLGGWDIAHWHVQANEWLAGQRPLDLLDTDLPAVLAAARADRYAVDG